MNKRVLMEKAFNCQKVDVLPVSFWFHFPPNYSVDELVSGHVNFAREVDLDFMKIMYEYPFPLNTRIEHGSDWRDVVPIGKESVEFKNQLEIIKRIKAELGDEMMIFMTSFSPTKYALMNVGDATFMEHTKTNPNELIDGISRISHVLSEWNKAFLETGIDGIYYSGQFSEPGRFTKEEWNRFVADFDRDQIRSIKNMNKRVILHICGEPEYEFTSNIEWYKDYDVDMVNWATHANNIYINEGRKILGKPVLGGLFNRGALVTGSDSEVREEVIELIKNIEEREGFVVGADCTIQGGINLNNLKTAIATVREE